MNLELEVSKSAFGGDGIAKHAGKTCFVEGALAGEKVIARVLQDKKNFLKAVTVKVLEPSPFRVEAPCRWAGACGGCQYQHVRYPEELRVKESQVRDLLQRALGQDSVSIEPIRYVEKEYGYRNSVTLHRTVKASSRPQRLGYIKTDNVSKIAIEECLIADPRLTPVFTAKFDVGAKTQKVSFRLGDDGRILDDRKEFFYRVRIGSEKLLACSQGFFQGNLAVTELLCRAVADWVRRIAPPVFYDLYAGVGTFAFLSAKDVPGIVCIEHNKQSLEALRMNASERGVKGLRVVQGLAEKAFPAEVGPTAPAGAMVCLDPPRQGLEKELAVFLSKQASLSAIVYVSCDPSTLARDLKILLGGDCFDLEQVLPFDMFPRTKHIETAVLLTGRRRDML